MGNPFAENSKDLFVLDSRDLADPAVIDTLRQIKSLGQEQYDTYVNKRLVNQTKPITDPMKRNNLPLFSRPPVREKSRAQLQRSSLKNECSLFSRLYIASQILISISSFNMKIKRIHLLYHKWGNCGQEQSLIWSADWKMSCLRKPLPPLLSYKSSCLMGLQSLPGFVKTFSDYATQVFLPYITSQSVPRRIRPCSMHP